MIFTFDWVFSLNFSSEWNLEFIHQIYAIVKTVQTSKIKDAGGTDKLHQYVKLRKVQISHKNYKWFQYWA